MNLEDYNKKVRREYYITMVILFIIFMSVGSILAYIIW